MGDALHTHGGVTDAKEARLAQAGLIAVAGPTILDARTGVLAGPGTTTLATGTSSTGTMTVAVAPHQWVTSRGAANGPYLGVLEAATTVNIAAAPGSGTRTDVVWVKQQDATAGIPSPDGTTAPQYGATTGTVGAGKPAIPVGAQELATVAVTAGATRTDGSGIVITNTARQTVARGAPVPVYSKAERDAMSKYPTLQVIRMDTADFRTETWNGTKWCFWMGGTITGTTDGSGLLTFAHGAGQAPLTWGPTAGQQTTDAISQVINLLAYFQDATNLTIRATRTDGTIYLTGNPISANWWAKF